LLQDVARGPGENAHALGASLARAAEELARVRASVEAARLQFLDALTTRFLRKRDTDPQVHEKLETARQLLAPHLSQEHARGSRTAEATDVAPDDESVVYHITSLLWSAGRGLAPPRQSAPDAAHSRAPSAAAPAARHPTAKNLPADELTPDAAGLLHAFSELIARNDKTIAQVDNVRIALEQADSDWNAHELRDVLRDGAHELLLLHRAVAQDLNDLQTRLKRLLASLPIGATGPARVFDRDIFLRSLELEAYRAQRYDYPLSVAIIDPSRLGAFVYATAAAGNTRQVLRSYADKVFARLRASDFVGRHGSHSFAVALPNTRRDQALCALRKIQSFAAASHYVYAGRERAVPTFYGGLTSYAAGESPATVLARAERALRRASGFDHHRIEVETAPGFGAR
jgi:diguanylate cyclase (GGDEF)-like protein